MKKIIKLGFVFLIIIAIANPLLSEEGKNKPPEKAQQTAAKASSETFQKNLLLPPLKRGKIPHSPILRTF